MKRGEEVATLTNELLLAKNKVQESVDAILQGKNLTGVDFSQHPEFKQL